MNCPHCQQPVFRKSGNNGKVKVNTSIFVLHKGGEAEINCPRCRRGIIIGRIETVQMRKAMPRLVVRTTR